MAKGSMRPKKEKRKPKVDKKKKGAATPPAPGMPARPPLAIGKKD